MMILAFFGLGAVIFATVMYVTRPPAGSRSVQGRLASLQLAGGGGRAEQPGTVHLKQSRFSTNAWLDGLLHRWAFSFRLYVLLAQADVRWSVSQVLFASALLAVLGCSTVYLWTDSAVPAMALAGMAGVIPIMVLRNLRDRRLSRFDQKLPEALDLMSRALRAGHSVSAAIEIVGQEAGEPVRSEFAQVHRQRNFGIPSRDALLQLGQRIPSTDLRVVITAILVQKETGGNLVEILDRTTTVLRDRQRIQGEVRVHTAQGRLTGWVLCALPFIMFGLISVTNPSYAAMLVQDPSGRKLAALGICMMAAGTLLIRRIVRIRV